MPKKTKKGRRNAPTSQKQVRASGAQAGPASTAQTTTEPSAAATRPTVAARAATAAKVDLAQEYHYVFTDLRKIAIIAVVMFALLFALAFVLR
jgi:hypothetical protein